MTDDVLELLNVSRETKEKLEAYSDLLIKWTKSINLIAPATIPHVWSRHILDSAQVFYRAPQGWTTWADIGSGGGLPGLVVAILDQQRRTFHFVESDQRKATFLRTAVRVLDLKAIVHATRIENTDFEHCRVVSARALAPLPELLAYATRLLDPDGTAIFQKGRKYQAELEEARKNWDFDVEVHPSMTSTESSTLCLTRIRPREH